MENQNISLILFKRSKYLIIILSVFFTACSRNNQKINESGINILVAVESTQVGSTSLLVTVSDEDGALVNDARVAVKGDMSHAGMVPVLANADRGENGVYELPFEWTMGGDWILTIEVVLPDGRSTTQTFNYSITN